MTPSIDSARCVVCSECFEFTLTSGPAPTVCSTTCRKSRAATQMRTYRAEATAKREVVRVAALRDLVAEIMAETA